MIMGLQTTSKPIYVPPHTHTPEKSLSTSLEHHSHQMHPRMSDTQADLLRVLLLIITIKYNAMTVEKRRHAVSGRRMCVVHSIQAHTFERRMRKSINKLKRQNDVRFLLMAIAPTQSKRQIRLACT